MGQDIERFITTIITYIIPRNPSAIPSYDIITNGLIELVCVLLFQEPFALSSHDNRRITALVDHHFHQGHALYFHIVWM